MPNCLSQCFLNFNEFMKQLKVLLKCRFWFIRSRVGLRFHSTQMLQSCWSGPHKVAKLYSKEFWIWLYIGVTWETFKNKDVWVSFSADLICLGIQTFKSLWMIPVYLDRGFQRKLQLLFTLQNYFFPPYSQIATFWALLGFSLQSQLLSFIMQKTWHFTPYFFKSNSEYPKTR